MSVEESPDFTIPSITIKELTEEQKPCVKPLYKVKVKDLLNIPFNEETDKFTFKNNEISLVMFGGKIESISSNDTIFSFYVNDGTGKIQCFCKNREYIELRDDQLNPFLDDDSEAFDNFSSSDSDDENFGETTEMYDALTKAFAQESKEMITDVLIWFKKEVITLAAEINKNVGDIVHISGQLLKSDFERKVQVMDFRIVENELEHEDFLLEIEYLHNNFY